MGSHYSYTTMGRLVTVMALFFSLLAYCHTKSLRLTKRGADAEAVADSAPGRYFGFGGGLRGGGGGFYGLGGGASYNHYHYGGGVSGGSNQQYYGEYYS